MKDKQKIQTDEATLVKSLQKLIPTGQLDDVLVKALDRLFDEGKWTIPDDAIAGAVANKVKQLDAQVASLTNLLGQVAAKLEGGKPPIKPGERVDALDGKPQPKSK